MVPRPNRKEYRRVPNAHEDAPKAAENEVRVVAQRGQRNYVAYAIEVLTGAEGKTQHDSVKITGMGAAVFNAVNIAEVVKRRVAGLHQTTDISSVSVVDKYEALEEGKEDVTMERKVATITIVLSLKPLDTKHIGYQPPLPADQVTAEEPFVPRERRPRAARDDEERPRRAARPRGDRDEEGEDRHVRARRPPRRPRQDEEEAPARGRGTRGAPRAPRRDYTPDEEPRRGRGRAPLNDAPRTRAPRRDYTPDEEPRRGRGRAPPGDNARPRDPPRTRGSAPSRGAPSRGGRGSTTGPAPSRGGRGGSRTERGGRGGYSNY